ncbi:MAG: AAA domain-containing protein [bacterium]|nr:AAA domain-containing protein [bacterium]
MNLYKGDGVKRGGVQPDYRVVTFDDPANYSASGGLRDAVNVALALGQPLLVTGEPGTGKTQLAASIAHELDLPLLTFNTKTTSTAGDLFYRYDALRRFHIGPATQE